MSFKTLGDVENFKLKNVYSYPSSMEVIFIEEEYDELSPKLKNFADFFIDQVKKHGLYDNKIVIELEVLHFRKETRQSLCLGWYDGRVKFGVGAYNKDNAAPKKISNL